MKKTAQLMVCTVVVIMLLLLTACGKKPMVTEELKLELSGGELSGDAIIVLAGTKAAVALNYEAEDFKIALGEGVEIPAYANVTILNNTVSMQPTEQGKFTIPLSISAKGYTETPYSLHIDTKLQQFADPKMTLENQDDVTIDDNKISMTKNTKNVLGFEVNPETSYTYVVTGDVFENEPNGNKLNLTAKEVGTAQLDVTLKQPYFQDKTISYVLECVLPKLQGTAELEQTEVEVGEKTTVATNFDGQKVVVSAVSDNENAAVSVKSNQIVVTGKAVGESNITVTAKSDGYQDFVNNMVVTVTPPKPRLDITLSKTKLAMEVGQSQTVTINNVPQDALVTVKGTGVVEVVLEGNTIDITLNGAAGGKVAVQVSKEGYKTYSATIGVNKIASRTSSNADYQEVLDRVNYHRTNEGLKPLVYRSDIDSLSKIRAKESATLFDHARPGNKTWYSVFTENGVRYKQIGENLARGTDPKLNNPTALVDAWMGSPAHRANIMSDLYEGMSVAKYVDESGKIHWAQLFITD